MQCICSSAFWVVPLPQYKLPMGNYNDQYCNKINCLADCLLMATAAFAQPSGHAASAKQADPPPVEPCSFIPDLYLEIVDFITPSIFIKLHECYYGSGSHGQQIGFIGVWNGHGYTGVFPIEVVATPIPPSSCPNNIRTVRKIILSNGGDYYLRYACNDGTGEFRTSSGELVLEFIWKLF